MSLPIVSSPPSNNVLPPWRTEPVWFDLPFVHIVSPHLILAGTDMAVSTNNRYQNRNFALTKSYREFKRHFSDYAMAAAYNSRGPGYTHPIIPVGSGAWGIRIWVTNSQASRIDMGETCPVEDLESSKGDQIIAFGDIDAPEKALLDALKESYILDDDVRLTWKLTTKAYKKNESSIRLALFQIGKYQMELPL